VNAPGPAGWIGADVSDGSESWLPVVGWEGLYQVSDWGRVRSLMPGSRAKDGLLKPQAHPSGHLHVSLYGHSKNGTTRKVHHLVLEAFDRPCPEGMECRHLDGNPTNNVLSNLVWGTRAENVHDSLRHGTNVNAAKTECDNGHEFTPGNTIMRRGGGRDCRECTRKNIRNQGYKRTARLKAERLAKVVFCEFCGKRFPFTRKDRIYCSRDCKNAAYAERNRKTLADLIR